MIIKNGKTIIGRTDNKQNELVAGDNITMQRDPQTGKTIISASGGGGGVSKEYVDTQDQALSIRITTNSNNINTLSARANQLQTDVNDLGNNVETLQTTVTNFDTIKANKSEVYTKTETDTLLGNKLTANGADRGLNITSNKIGHSNSLTPPATNARFICGVLDGQGHFRGTPVAFSYSDVYNSTLNECLFTRKGANNMYVNYLKSTNGTLTKATVITTDYSHYVKCGNIYQLSIGFQNSSTIAKNVELYTLPETISNNSIEMYIVISNIVGDTRILQCGGSYGGNKLCAKADIPTGYWFGSTIFIKL